MTIKSFPFITKSARVLTARWKSALVVLLLLGGGVWWWVAAHQPTVYQFVTVTQGPITETVSVTGNTRPIDSVELGFQNSGTIAGVYSKIGDHVAAGEVLATLNTASLNAQLQQAIAAYDAAVASKGSTSLPEATTEARNVYRAGYTTLDTVLHSDVDLFYGGSTAYGPELSINAPMYNFGEMSQRRAVLENELAAYRESLGGAGTADPVALLDQADAKTQRVSTFLNLLAVAANANESQATATQLAGLSAARTAVDTLLAKLSAARDAFRTSSAGATSLATADVEKAAAGVASVRATLIGSKIVAPISGVVTQFDAKVGQTAGAGSPLVSIISAGGFEVQAGVPETNIGKLAIGNKVSMTLDAFNGETFEGTVFYIEPAETVTQGVVDYKIKVAFTKADPRMKSGLTANLDIETRHRDTALLLPQYAILQNDQGTFVEVLENKKVKELPVTLGIQDKDGRVEILTGVTADQQVLNIGLKK